MSRDAPLVFWRYHSSFPAAIAFAVLYTSTCIITTLQYFWYRSWFWYLIVVASIMESLGYICRSISLSHKTWQNPYFIQYLMIFLAPALFAAGCYMAMGRIIFAALPSTSEKSKSTFLIPARFLAPIFVTCDMVAFLIQVIGAASTLNAHSDAVEQRGINIARVGLGIQVLCFGLFLLISIRFHFVATRYQRTDVVEVGTRKRAAGLKAPVSEGRSVAQHGHARIASRGASTQLRENERWRKLLYAINVVSVLIFVRTIYRLVEFSTGGVTGYAGSHDWTFYCFEGGLILPCLVAFNFIHPAKYLGKENLGFRQRRTVSFTAP